MGLETSDNSSFDGQRIMAITDMNNDNQIDLVTVNSDSDAVTVHYFDDTTGQFTNTSQFNVQDNKIVSIVPSSAQTKLQGLALVLEST